MDSSSNGIWMNLAFQAGGGVILGFATGFAVKKLLKLLLIVLGLFTLGLLYLANEGIISVNYDALKSKIEGAAGHIAGAGVSMKTYIIMNVPFAASFLVGFAAGFKLG
ncbi:MAG: hypothetical protein F7B59_04265 [Desulfurococcales archaeon]|nr:hypothetical protein [Desulfurococcales archaeon]